MKGDVNSGEFEKIEESKIDLLNLKIFALLVCKGKSEEKADILFDIIMGPTEEIKDKDNVISWMNPRLVKSVRQIIYFSEIFPKKYLTNFMPNLAGVYKN